ncbi:hypothetical protein [Microlunatus parietis]|uniref:Conjugative transposon protein TcpC n=1 Tax=Microlunatus parietis TaxID=682979 RepID=A0A7Y9LG19_9ACTN|nr:hypothetical protein [Microlunatus parietis]NYE74686.1 hypothetical protein [Microlunatus parietis]
MKTANGARKIKNVDWWDEPDTLPVVVDPNRGKARRRLITIYLWVSAILFPFLIFTVIVLGVRVLTPPVANTGPTSDTTATREAAQAQVAVEEWLSSNPSPLPGGRVVAYIGSSSKPAQPREGEENVVRTLATYRFVLAAPESKMYETSIQLLITPSGAIPLTEPALVPIRSSAPGAGDQAEWPWPGIDSMSAPAEYTSAVSAWAKAYTGGDPAALKLAVGDPDASRSYLPLTGVTFSAPAIRETGALWAEDQERTRTAKPRQALVRVSFTVVWAAVGQGTQQPRLTYDLLLDRADTAAPAVVAWGSPGSELTPYGNAVTESGRR